jgi:hypothetical protein
MKKSNAMIHQGTYSARHHLTNTARVPPKTYQNFERFFFRKETHEKNVFATILYFFPRVSLFSTKIKKNYTPLLEKKHEKTRLKARELRVKRFPMEGEDLVHHGAKDCCKQHVLSTRFPGRKTFTPACHGD